MFLSTMKPRVVKKTVEIFSLANNYHSLFLSDAQASTLVNGELKQLIINGIEKDFEKSLSVYSKRGHQKFKHISDIKTPDDAVEFAECFFINAWGRA